jgi:hypothetical protein
MYVSRVPASRPPIPKLMTAPIFTTKHWTNILYIGNLVVKIFDYYGITNEKICPLCKLEHIDEESLKGRYKAGSYFIKCE